MRRHGFRPWLGSLLKLILALVIGTASGVAANAAGLPLPWMMGPMIGTTSAALAGAPIRSPARLRSVFLPVLGVMLGSSIDTRVIEAMARWGVAVALLVPFLALASAAAYWFYRRVGGYDRPTAFFSAMPGGLNEMILMGGRAQGDERRIAMAHATRIMSVVAFGVLFFGLALGVTSSGSRARGTAILDIAPMDWLILAGCAVIGLRAGTWLRLPAALIAGPMLLSGAAHAAGIITVAPPSVLVIAAQVVIGTVIGGRFVGAAPGQVGRDIALGTGASLMMIAIAALFALIASRLTGMAPTHTFLAYSPGGLTEMSLLALAMGQEVAYVSVMHVARIVLVIAIAPSALRGLSPRQGGMP